MTFGEYEKIKLGNIVKLCMANHYRLLRNLACDYQVFANRSLVFEKIVKCPST